MKSSVEEAEHSPNIIFSYSRYLARIFRKYSTLPRSLSSASLRSLTEEAKFVQFIQIKPTLITPHTL